MFKVLLVDDEAFFRQGLKELIDWEKCGFIVAGETDNGEDALDLIAENPPDVVITDIRMPVMDGMELIQKSVQERGSTTKFIIVSGYDEFEYAQKAVKYGVCDFILKPIDESAMEETLCGLRIRLEREAAEASRSKSSRSSGIIASLISGQFSEAEAKEWGEQLGLSAAGPFTYLFAEPNEPAVSASSNDLLSPKDIKQRINQAAPGLLPALPSFHTHEHRNRLGILVPEGLLPEGCSLRRLVLAIQDMLERETGQEICMYVGSAVLKLSQLKNAYLSAKETMLYKYTDEHRGVFFYDKLRDLPRNDVIMEHAGFRALNDAMEENNESAIRKAVNDLFDEFRNRRFVPEAVRTSIHRCVSEALESLNTMGADTGELHFKGPMLSWYDRSLTASALKELFASFVLECSRLAASRRKTIAKGGIHKVISYVDSNYADNISLKSIAAHFYMNPVYLGQLFKKNAGVYFNEYVLQLRVNEAKRLLRQSDSRVYEIADKVGFSNAEYFVSQFEKLENMTPTEYRNSLR